MLKNFRIIFELLNRQTKQKSNEQPEKDKSFKMPGLPVASLSDLKKLDSKLRDMKFTEQMVDIL